MKRCVIVGGADINNYDYIRKQLSVDDFVVERFGNSKRNND